MAKERMFIQMKGERSNIQEACRLLEKEGYPIVNLHDDSLLDHKLEGAL